MLPFQLSREAAGLHNRSRTGGINRFGKMGELSTFMYFWGRNYDKGTKGSEWNVFWYVSVIAYQTIYYIHRNEYGTELKTILYHFSIHWYMGTYVYCHMLTSTWLEATEPVIVLVQWTQLQIKCNPTHICLVKCMISLDADQATINTKRFSWLGKLP